ncbi:T9SS type A sorting domain-containing protein [Neolewinella aurantiaca]|uniref:T9SS type A sorting domain-containing protein n=1 Tax=Neolewinella aurantiaca TaxID=2602767 RepID=A0A5C7FS40_9BACT|nr:T9SS type A sorting domain-containing protein [Neolewinella aurantiaca]TXF88263.1 T9SS type A sorting domain-containing protein [Neolewinella aurantiaca]
MKIMLSSFICLISLVGYSQQDTIFHEFPLFFEDAVGNKDTVYIGLSEFANSEFNPHLGEVNLVNVPFDSVFEVRLAIFDELAEGDLPTYLGKSRYAGIQLTMDDLRDCTRLRIFDGISFVVHSLHPPLKIRWNSEIFREDGELHCIGGTWINNTHAPLVDFGWEELHENSEAYTLACLRDTTEMVIVTPFRTFSGESGTIDASDLPSGLYLLKAVFNDGRSGTAKFVKH